MHVMMKFSVAVGLMLTMCSALRAQGKIVASENDVVSVGHVVNQVAVDSRVLFSQVQDAANIHHLLIKFAVVIVFQEPLWYNKRQT